MKFTDRQIKALKPKADRYEVWEDNGKGLGVRVSPTGRKSWIYLYRFQGKARRMTLGVYPAMSVAHAHQHHATARESLEKGGDPGKALTTSRALERRALTVAALIDTYVEKYAKPNKRSWQKDAYMLKKELLPDYGDLKANTITRRDINLLLDKVVERGVTTHANRILAVIRKMFNFAIARGELTSNPCAGVNRPSPENKRDRVLTTEEIKKLWQTLPQAAMTLGSQLALKLMLLTAQRKGEIISAKWINIDRNTNWWVIPAELSKNKRQHRVYLSPPAQEVLMQAKKIAGESSWVFPSPKGDQAIGDTALNHAITRNLSQFDVDPFIVHDLRRTAASHMTAMQISRLVVSKILNHAESSVTAIYDRYQYDIEKQKALTEWGEKLMTIVNE